MSNWGRPYFSNNQNYSSASSYHNNRPNNSNSGHGNDSRWHYYQQQQPPPSNNSSSSSQSVGGVYLPSHRQQYNGTTSSTNMESDIFYPSHVRGGAPAVDFNSSLSSSSSSSRNGLMNNPLQFNNSGRSHLNSDIWAKAANSNLVPTAGEFFPSGNFHQPPPAVSDYQGGSRHELNNNSSTNDNQWKFGGGTGQRSDSSLSGSQYEGAANHRGGGGNGRNYSGSHHLYNSHHQSSSNRNPSKSNYNREYHQKNNNNSGKSGWNNHSNSSNYSNRGGTRNNYGQSRSSNSSSTYGRGPTSSNSRLDDQKSEGRKKLLEEVATLLTHPQDGPCTISLSSSSSSSSTDLHSSRAGGCNSEEEELRKVIHLTNIVDRSNVRSSGDYKRNYNHFRRNDRGAENFGTPPPFPSRVFNNTNMSAVTDKQLSDRTGLLNQDNTVSQRERLTEQLERGTLECLVCYDRVRQTDSVWNCSNCFHVLHLRCIIRWANSSRSETGWRCPACQNVSKLTPRNYYCFCGKVIDPDWNRGNDIPHSCGEVCNKPKPNPSPYFQCNHPCTLLCHPGPCPPCITMIHRNCGCGRTSQMIQCGQNSSTISCGETCCKGLNCGEHFCSNICHLGDCKPCPAKISQECYCGTMSREVACDKNNINVKNFECGNECPKKLECGEHPCLRNCHPGSCGPCPLDPSRVTHCPCGKMPINNVERKSCLDPVPTCSEICSKSLTCGQPGNPHMCKSVCHEGNCPTCDRTTLVRCRCGHMDKEIPCKDLTTKADDARCQKKCPKKRSCGKHKCNQLCCIEVDHVCPIPCNHMLTCGQHRCEELCHRGHCKPCWRTSFEELFCECRSSVLFPPIPCGTRPPECKKPCSRQHNCDHPALHSCHSEPNCPPCTVLTAKYCHGMHELRKTVPCHLEEFSCGMPCNKELPCGHHKCILPCHKGECLKPGQSCVQPCTKTRSLCGHPCNAPCHEDECPDTPCKETVKVTCECGNRTMTRPCCENNKEYQRIATSLLASKMADVQLGRCIDLQDMQGARNKMSLKTLECNDECRIVERNRRMSIGLQIRNPDLSSKLTPRYSDFMRGWAKKDPKFCQHVHDKLSELVHLAKQSKQKSRSYSFETMNREKRQFVHEYCEHFGCESVAYDAEPKRNIVATAQRDKAWLPSYSLLEVIQREMGQRKVPLPTLNGIKKPATAIGTTRASATAPLVRLGQNHQQLSSLNSTQQPSSTQQHLNSNSNSYNKIDYFNYTNT